MAVLRSEDTGSISRLEIKALGQETLGDQLWQHFSITLTSGSFTFALGSQDPSDRQGRAKAERFRQLNETVPLDQVHPRLDEATVSAAEDCLFCRTPRDEVAKLALLLHDLVAKERTQVLFEPAEPSFELKVERDDDAIKVEVWLDSGNAKSGIYRWDAAGVRFFTLPQHVDAFARALKEEFAC